MSRLILRFGAKLAAGFMLIAIAATAQAANYPWTPINRGKCLPTIERQYHTGGDWVFDVARCTAHFYPPTSALSPERCVAEVWSQTKYLCKQCGPSRVDQVMLCLTSH